MSVEKISRTTMELRVRLRSQENVLKARVIRSEITSRGCGSLYGSLRTSRREAFDGDFTRGFGVSGPNLSEEAKR